ncbi:MAG: hypothetical protein JWL58_1184 [Streptosporangiaceae bacterium]|nr:hypothetical protein [Streptosporangiaceae bacterium]
MQVTAHPDDDLLFMNPDVMDDIRNGMNVETVVLTAGESGAGIPPDTHDPKVYTAERDTGQSAAYAAMAGVPDTWRVSQVRSGNISIEVRTLVGRPGVRIARLYLPDGGDRRSNLGRNSLTRLQTDSTGKLCARLQPQSPGGHVPCYTHRDVVRALTTLLALFRPQVVRTQDAYPDVRYQHDHNDHIAAARLTDEAVRVHAVRYPGVLQVGYQDYSIMNYPENLTATQHLDKTKFFQLYAQHDYRLPKRPTRYLLWPKRMRYRWSRGSAWLGTGPDGRTQAFAISAGRLMVWWQDSGGWRGPTVLGDGGGALAQAIQVEQTPAGPAVAALRPATDQIVIATPRLVQGRWQTSWASAGSPSPGSTGERIGVPVIVRDAKGQLLVFARDARGGVSVRCGIGGKSTWHRLSHPSLPWEPSHDLHRTQASSHQPVAVSGAPVATPGGPTFQDLQDGLITTTTNGRIDLFGESRTAVLHWQQSGPCAFAPAGTIAGARPTSRLGLTRDAQGHSALVYQQTGSLDVMQTTGSNATVYSGPVLQQTGEAPVPVDATVPSLGISLVGAPATIREGGHQVVYAIAADGRLYRTAQDSKGTFGRWRSLS